MIFTLLSFNAMAYQSDPCAAVAAVYNSSTQYSCDPTYTLLISGQYVQNGYYCHKYADPNTVWTLSYSGNQCVAKGKSLPQP